MFDSPRSLADLLRRDERYDRNAYLFVSDALSFALEDLGMGRPVPDSEGRHEDVTGQELCEAIRCYALQQYGLLAKHVLSQWGIRSTSDVGEIVFNLIEIGKMKKTDSDRREHFDDVFDFDLAFCDPFRSLTPDSREERRW
jgi:uncharacterized repeat protein (TIGR04138 family)